MLGELVGGFVIILIGVTLAPTVANTVKHATSDTFYGPSPGYVNTTITGSSGTILDLTTLFYVLAVASAGIAIAAQGLRAAGMLTA